MTNHAPTMTPQAYPLWASWIDYSCGPQEPAYARVIGWRWEDDRQAFVPVVFRRGNAETLYRFVELFDSPIDAENDAYTRVHKRVF